MGGGCRQALFEKLATDVIATPAAASLSLEEAAAFLGVHPVTLQAIANSGQVRGRGRETNQPHKQPHVIVGRSVESAMLFVAILFIAFCLAIGHMHEDLWKLLLVGAWAGMALMAIGATLYSAFLLLA